MQPIDTLPPDASPQPAVVVTSGHMTDAPDRTEPRFPEVEVGRVRREVRDTLVRWGVGPGTTVISGGARGADLIVAQEAEVLGARVILFLAKPPEEFERDSVDVPGTDWGDQFQSMLRTAEVRVLPRDRQPGDGEQIYAATNDWMIDSARDLLRDGRIPNAIVVWNGQGGDGPGGTRHFIQRLGFDADDPRIRIIDPTPSAPPGAGPDA